MSRTIKALEEDLGEQLFIRTSRSTRLTRAGKLFLDHAPPIFTTMHQARDSVQAAADSFYGQSHIALSDGITPADLVGVVPPGGNRSGGCRSYEPKNREILWP